MKPECEAFGEKWAIVSRTDEKQVGGVREVVQWWTGTSWAKYESLARKFDSEAAVNEYIEHNRARLEA